MQLLAFIIFIMEDDDQTSRKRRKRDGVWEHVVGEDNGGTCFCRHCAKKWSFSITEKVDTVRLHFGVDKNGHRIPGKSAPCPKNPYAPSAVQNAITAHLVAPMTPALQKKFQDELSCWFYETGTPFVRVEHPRMKKTFTVLRADVILPKRKELAGELLVNRFNTIKANVLAHMLEGMGKICITTDGWSTQHRHSLTNYMAVTAGRAFFFDSEMTGASSHTGQFIAQRLAHFINEVGAAKVSGATTDNTAANQ